GIYDVIKTSGKEKEGIEALQQRLKGKKSALTGPSGVGKSTLLNGLKPRAEAETGGVSEKTGRGKHTTRHVEIFQLDEESMVYDTPGFTSFDILEAEEHELQFLYPEMQAYLGGCKYDNCRHVKEPECMVRKAVSEGKINASRYASYQAQLEDIMNKKKY
ncbi:MAG: ribosome small subunit-dependent GTPase A, partial [Anaerovoracaceae bacterium]